MPGGEYVANVHMYRGVGITYPVMVKVVASLKSAPQESARQIVATTVPLHHQNEEITAFRFTLDSRGHLVAGSINSLSQPLRVANR
jgi:hypothetical protein